MDIYPLIPTSEAADILGLQPNTLEKWRLSGEGPTFVRVGRSIRYRRQDLAEWINGRRSSSTSSGHR
jgi:excisionase family DNA binding protein